MPLRGKKTTQAGPAQCCGPSACDTPASARRGRGAGGAQQPATLREALAACRQGFVALFVFSMTINLLLLVSPIYMMQLYDRVLSSQSMDTLVLLTMIAMFGFAVLGGLELVRGRLMVRVSSWLDRRLGGPVLASSIVGALRQGKDRTAQSLRDLSTFRTFLTGPNLFPVLDAPWAPVFLAVIFLLSPLLGFLATGGAAILFALGILNEKVTRQPLSEANKAVMAAQYQADASVRNADVIEAMGMMPNLIERWERRSGEAVRLQALAGDRGAMITSLSKFVRVAIQSLILGAGAYLVIQHEATGGVMIGASIILGRALAPVEQMIAGWRNLMAARAAFQRVKAALAALPARNTRTQLPAPKGHVSLEGVVFQPPGTKEPVIKGVSFDLEPGQALALIGPSAAGKTSLVRLIVGNWVPQRGSVRLDGAELQTWDADALGPHIGYLPQDVELFSGTVRDNIARMGEGSDALVIEAAQRAQAHEMILELPNGYDTEIGDGGAFLSGGQRQRIGLARALYGNPKLIVLDEPNASLDSAAENRLMQTLFQLKQQKTTIILITHRLSLVAVADKVLLMKSGVAEAFGSRDEVMSKLTRAVASGPGNVAMMPKPQAPQPGPMPAPTRPHIVTINGSNAPLPNRAPLPGAS
jgi:ATP-binding cassette, subfamily C, type I secretion system permease/ATPase